MRSRGLSFADAVGLLDGDSELVDRLGSAAGVAAGAVTAASLGTVDFFALRDQVVRWGNSAARSWRDRVRGLSRFDRTERLVAAHTVIVLVAFYEALDAWTGSRGGAAQHGRAHRRRTGGHRRRGATRARLREHGAATGEHSGPLSDAAAAGRVGGGGGRGLLPGNGPIRRRAPGDLQLPTLREGYQEPSGQSAVAGPASLPAAERWWAEEGRPVAAVQDLLVAILTTPQATEQPIVVLGQPGSGKSVLTRVLAARLAGTDFLPVRVELRSVRADAPVIKQIEEALHLQLGETVTWPDVVRRGHPALPIVMMDGFDELLQATGQNWASYLEQLQDFQERQAEVGRPLAVLVTSRTVVADRARFPAGTPVVRLEPFGDEQVSRWLAVWNGLNESGLARRGLSTLPVEVALEHRELASQPLLLLLLAIYDSRANKLQHASGGLGRVDLYENLFTDFFERQVEKFGAALGREQREAEVTAEWRRLCAVAIAMHNRGRDVILEPELEEDARQLLSAEDRSLPTAESRTLSVGQLLVGRFFFVHESQASRDTGSGVERSFEFLHATFGEFLAARQIVNAMVELAEVRAVLPRRIGSTLDAGFFPALTSFATIARRAPLWEFGQGMIARLDPGVRRRCRELVLELLPDAGFTHPTWSFGGYEPERRTMAQRQASFAANLVCLAVLLSDGPVDAVDLVGEPVAEWNSDIRSLLGLLFEADSTQHHAIAITADPERAEKYLSLLAEAHEALTHRLPKSAA